MNFGKYKYKIENNSAVLVGVIFLVISAIYFIGSMFKGNAEEEICFLLAFVGFIIIGALLLLFNYLRKCFVCLKYLCEYFSDTDSSANREDTRPSYNSSGKGTSFAKSDTNSVSVNKNKKLSSVNKNLFPSYLYKDTIPSKESVINKTDKEKNNK